MKKLFVAAALALALTALSTRPASAWHKFNLNAGISLNCESGNNCFLWGLCQDGQVPGWPTDVCKGCYQSNCAPQGYPPYACSAIVAPPGVDYGGCATCPSYAQNTQPALAAQQNGPMQAVYYPNQYGTPNYGYNPNYNTGFSQVPSYWYGR